MEIVALYGANSWQARVMWSKSTLVEDGYTLIELMIVVAIIGVLAAFAFAQYQDYVTRSRWAAIWVQVAQIQIAVADCAQNNGGSPASPCGNLSNLESNGFLSQNFALPSGSVIYGASLDYSTVTDTITVNGSGISVLGGCTVSLTASATAGAGGAIAWTPTITPTPLCNSRMVGLSG